MIASIARNDWRMNLRSGVFIGLVIAIIALLIGAAALSSQRLASFERERSAAEAVDREVWDSQGARNPHSAAHFSRYAFKPLSPLMAFDPGVTDYAGLAVWMEAHYQNPAVFRRAEDLGDAGRFADLSPAWILQYIAPLFLFLILFPVIAGEREQGTLQQMTAAGISATTLLWGKLTGALAIIAALLVIALLLGFWSAGSGGAEILPDSTLRTLGLAAAYTVYLVAAGAIAIGISARCREKRTALIALVGVWAVCFILVPRLAASAAISFYPAPDATHVTHELSEASSAFYEDDDYRAELEATMLEKYDVQTVEELPINYGGYSLQASEEHAEPLFEAVYARLDGIYRQQEALITAASIFSPVLAMESLSAGLAGTDRVHHRDFALAAEEHRRTIIQQLNDDLTYNAGDAGYEYTNDKALWQSIADFEHRAPRFASLAPGYFLSALILLLYMLASLAFATWAVRRAQRTVAS
ncbi:MAG: DUF3526 domain-containing protein [Pseudomonadota bacterium]